jgi:radical SAM superfamily enzyme YgiQ (UPF0313 family)
MGDRSDLRIDFINFMESRDESNSYPMGILYISALLKENGFTNIGYNEHICLLRKIGSKKGSLFYHGDPAVVSKYYLEQREEAIKALVDDLTENQSKIILLGPITTFYLVELMDLVPKLRENFLEQIIISGGPHFGKDDLLDCELLETVEEIDGIVIGDAEETILDLATRYYKNLEDPNKTNLDVIEHLSDIPGLKIKGHNYHNRDSPRLCKIPRPDWELLESSLDPADFWSRPKFKLSDRRNPVMWVKRANVQAFDGGGNGVVEDDVRYFDYLFPSKDRRFPFGVIIGSRGCPYNCSFCGSKGIRRTHTAERVFNDIRYLNEKYGVRLFVFFDPLFTTANKYEQARIREFCERVIESGLDIGYMLDIRVDIVLNLPDELLELMLISGCTEMNFGLEKGSDEMLQKMTKGVTVLDQNKAVTKLREISEKVGENLIINGTFILGGPDETKMDIRDTLIQCFNLHLDQATLYPLEICPGTEIAEEAYKRDLIGQDLDVYLDQKEYPLFTSEELPEEYLIKIKKSSERVLDLLEEVRKNIQGLERQFIESKIRDHFSYFEIKETKTIHYSIEQWIEKILEYIKNYPDEKIVSGWKFKSPIDDYVKKVDTEILRIENKILEKYPEYDPYFWDYHPGFLKNTWNYFAREFVKLFSRNNFQ